MARNHARLLTSIWNDDDFLALTADAQRIFMLLLSQQNLSHAGLLPMTVKRWANKAKDTTAEQVEEFLMELDRARFVVIDNDTEELLIRSFIRGDEVYKQPNVMLAACKDAEAIASDHLRLALAVEVDRVRRIEGLPQRSSTALEALALDLPNPNGTLSEPQAGTSTRATGMGSVTEVSTGSPAPTPSPTPAPVPALRAEPTDDPTSQLLVEHINAYAQPPPLSAQQAVKTEIMRMVAERVEPERIRAGLARLRDKRLAASLLPQLVTETADIARPSTTDQRVATGLALVEKYRSQEGA